MLSIQRVPAGDSIFFVPCLNKTMRKNPPGKTSGRGKGTGICFMLQLLIYKVVREYRRILPRPPEVHGQPLSITQRREGAGSGRPFRSKI